MFYAVRVTAHGVHISQAMRRPTILCSARFALDAIGRLQNAAVDSDNPPRATSLAAEEPMPPDYESQEYWNARFDGERHFEWLGDGTDTIIPHVRTFLLDSRANKRGSAEAPSRLLHIGAGTSSLSERLRELYVDIYGDAADENAIVNTDFAEKLVRRKRETEEARRAKGGLRKGMQWVCADALKWQELSSLVGPQSEPFDLVVEKSTSDAISCGEDVNYSRADSNIHPVFHKFIKVEQGRTLTLSPVEVFAIHLATLVRSGGLWVALTFSSTRFSFMSPTASGEPSRPRASDYWTMEKMLTVDAPTGMEGSAYAPVVQHYVCLLRRREDRGQRNVTTKDMEHARRIAVVIIGGAQYGEAAHLSHVPAIISP